MSFEAGSKVWHDIFGIGTLQSCMECTRRTLACTKSTVCIAHTGVQIRDRVNISELESVVVLRVADISGVRQVHAPVKMIGDKDTFGSIQQFLRYIYRAYGSYSVLAQDEV